MLPVPVVIVAGFLGAGKTSLVNRLIGQFRDSRVAVVANDFSAINIDGELVVGIDGNVYGLANGCISCAIRDDLIEHMLRQRLKRVRNVVVSVLSDVVHREVEDNWNTPSSISN